MGGVSDGAFSTVGPWPAGVNNVAPEDGLPTDPNTGAVVALREAVNVDLDNDGYPSRRKGRTNRVAADRAHSLFASPEYLFAWVDGDLKAFDNGLNEAATIRSSIGERHISYAQVNDEVYWTNGVYIGRVTAELEARTVGVLVPPTPTLTASATGGMEAGDYEVAITWVDTEGQESGACPSQVITVPAGGGVVLTNLPAGAADIYETRVYCSAPNGEVLYKVAGLNPAQPVYYLTVHTAGKALDTQWLLPMPPGDIIRFWNGRVFVAATNFLCWSEGLRFGLMHQDNTLRFGARITLLEPVGEGGDGGGLYIADHKRTYFMSGDSPDKWSRVIKYPHAAVPGTSMVLPGTALGLETTSPVAFWMATNGVMVAGLPGGRVLPLTEGRLALPDAERGASMYREYDGLRQVVLSFLSGERNVASVSDSASATIRRHGVTVD